MKRRAAIRNLVFVAGGIVFLPACSNRSGNATIKLRNITVSADQQELLAEVVSVIIPLTNTPGAKELKLDLFVWKMVDDLYEPDKQQLFISGLNRLNVLAEKQFGHSFVNCTAVQKEDMLTGIEKAADQGEMTEFFQITKQRTIEGYLNSKYVMTHLNRYEMIPSVKYNGYYPVKSI